MSPYRRLPWVTLLLPCLLSAGDQPNDKPLSLCEIAKDPARHSGKTVRMKAEIAISAHGGFLLDAKCPRASVGGYTWSNCAAFGDAEADTDSRELLHLAVGLYLERSSQKKPTEMEAVLIGELHTIQSYNHTVVRDGLASGSGFGYQKAAPFRLAVKRVEFLSIRLASSTESKAETH